MDLNELDYESVDDFVNGQVTEEVNQEVTPDEPIEQKSEESSALESYLMSQGISDIHKIKFEDEDGIETERDWDDLSHDEQVNILKSGQVSDPSVELDDDEIDLINQIRLSRMTPQQYLSSLQPAPAVEEPSYVVDDLSDDELYMLDLQTRIEGITDEQLQNSLAKAKEDEDLFNKQIAGIRDEYKRLEDERNAYQAAQQEEMFNQQYNQFSNSINTAIANLTNIGELDIALDNNDMDELSSFILDQDSTGTSYFAKALNDPEELVKMAWFALHGEDMFNSISDYYKKQITQVSRNNYKKGYDDAMNGKTSSNKVVVKPKIQNVKSVDNLTY